MCYNPVTKMENDSSAVPLVRRLGLWSAIALVVSNMIGTGIFTTTGFLAGDLGSPWLVLLIWGVGAIFALAGALCYSELAVNFPASGGEYVYLREAYGPVWGFLSGWVSFFAGFSAPIAAAALAFSGYLAYVLPAIGSTPWFHGGWNGISWAIGPQQVLAAGLIVALTLVNCFDVAVVARVQNGFTAAKVAIILVFGIAAFWGRGSFQNFNEVATRSSDVPVMRQFAISLFWVMFGYSGWNAATYVAGELREPATTLPRALIAGTAIVALLYVLLNVVFIFAVPLDKMKGVVAVGALAASSLFGGGAAAVFGFCMAVAIVSTVNAMVTIGPRVYFAMAEDGAFVAAAKRVHPRTRVPVLAVLVQGACAAVLAFTSFPQLVTYIGFALTFFTVLAVAALFRLRRREGWRRLRWTNMAFPLVPGAYLMVGAWMLFYGVLLRPAISIAVVLTLSAGGLVYWSALKRSRIPL